MGTLTSNHRSFKLSTLQPLETRNRHGSDLLRKAGRSVNQSPVNGGFIRRTNGFS